MRDFKKNFTEYLEKLPKKSKSNIIILTVSSTSKKFSGLFYFTPIRMKNDFVICGIVFKDTQFIEILLKYLNIFDYVFVDQEKKIFDNNKNPVNIEKDLVLGAPNTVKICSFKPNDLTVDASYNEILNYFTSRKKTMGGAKALVMGAGNVGSKLSLRLVEVGVDTFLYRRSVKKCATIVDSINLIKPEATLAKAHPIQNISTLNNYKFDVIIGATNSTMSYIPTNDLFDNVPLILDIGKGSFDLKFLDIARGSGCIVLRSSVEDSLVNSIKNSIEIDWQQPKRKKISEKWYVSGGYLGAYGDIVVDDADNPKFEYGIANGNGDFIGR